MFVRSKFNHSQAHRTAPLLALAFLFSASPAQAEIFRCIVDGRVIYADHPCGGKTTQLEIVPTPPAAVESPERKLQTEANAGRVLVGMSMRQVTQAWGKPADVMTEKDAQGTHEEWNYARSGERISVRFDDGKVAKLTQRKIEAPPPRQAQNLTVSEMEENERIEKAAERRFLREGMTQEQVRGKLGPPSDRRVQTTRFGMAECWTYRPAQKDHQTQTALCFDLTDSRLVTIERTVQR